MTPPRDPAAPHRFAGGGGQAGAAMTVIGGRVVTIVSTGQ